MAAAVETNQGLTMDIQPRNGELEVVASLTQVQTRGKVPVSRFIHATAELGGKFYTFGGRDKEGSSLDDVSVYDPVTSTSLDLETMPKKLAGLTATVYENKVYIFGGTDGDNYNSDILCYTAKSNTWESISTSGRGPAGRYCHSCVIDDNQMYVIGGDNHKDKLNELWVFDLSSQKWTEVKQKGKSQPEPMQGFTAAVYEKKIYIFGGYLKSKHSAADTVWTFDLKTNEWQLIESKGTQPNGRHGHVGVVFGDSWIIHGGRKDHGEKYNIDVYEFQFGNSEWRRLGVVQHAASPWGCPAVRFGHQAALDPYTNSILLTGGYTHTDGVTFCPTNTILRLDLLPTLHSVNELNKKIAPLEDQMVDIKNESQALKSSFGSLEGKVDELSSETQKLKDKDSELEGKLDQITNEAIPILELQAKDLEGKLKLLSDQEKDLEEKEQALEVKENELELKVEKLEADVNQLCDLAGLSEGQELLRTDLNDVNERARGLENSLSDLANENKKLAEQNAAKIEELTTKLNDLDKKETELEAKTEELQKQEQALEEKANDIEEKVKNLMDNNNGMKDILDNLEALKEKMSQLQAEHNDLNDSVGKLADMTAINEKIELLRNAIEANVKETEKMRDIGKTLAGYGSEIQAPDFTPYNTA